MLKNWLKLLGIFCFDVRYIDDPAGGGDAGGDDGGASAGDDGAGGESWTTGMDWGEEGFEVPEKVAEFKSPAELAKAYEQARSKINAKGILKPSDDASEEDKSAYQAQLRSELGIEVPETADGYEWEPPEEIKEDFDEVGLKESFDTFRKAGMSKDHVKVVMDSYAESLAGIKQQMTEVQATRAKEAETALKEEWGDEYSTRMADVAKLQERFPDAVNKLKASGLANDKDILKLFDETARSVREDKIVGTPAASGTVAERIKALKEGEAYTTARHPEHRAVMKQILDLQKQA